MEQIKEYFRNNFKNCTIHENAIAKERIVFIADEIMYLIISPHKCTHYKWMLEITTQRAFDTWSNSSVVKAFFNSENELCNYLENNETFIYKNLLKYLSSEYKNLETDLEETTKETVQPYFFYDFEKNVFTTEKLTQEKLEELTKKTDNISPKF